MRAPLETAGRGEDGQNWHTKKQAELSNNKEYDFVRGFTCCRSVHQIAARSACTGVTSCIDVCLSVHRCICVEKKNQLDATEWLIALIICSTCFGHFYTHHQELETICLLLPPMVCSAWLLVFGGQVQGSRLCVQEGGCCTVVQVPLPGHIACCPAPDPRQPATKHCAP